MTKKLNPSGVYVFLFAFLAFISITVLLRIPLEGLSCISILCAEPAHFVLVNPMKLILEVSFLGSIMASLEVLSECSKRFKHWWKRTPTSFYNTPFSE